jgi:DegV family protein with EDD domain
MKKVSLVTDSAASLPAELCSRYEIDVVPLNLVLDDRSYPDGMDGNTDEFYRSLKASRRPPKTAGASPGAHLDAFRRISEKSPAVLYVSVSDQFSGTYSSGVQAAAMLKAERPKVEIEVIDSRRRHGTRVRVPEAARALKKERPAGAARRAQDVIPKVGIVAVIDTLEYLARGGRVPKVQAWASALLRVKPILELRQQDVRLLTRTRTKRRAVAQLVPLLVQRGWKGEGLHLCVQHTNALDEAIELIEEARRELKPVELLVSEFTLVMGVHTGTDFALAYYLNLGTEARVAPNPGWGQASLPEPQAGACQPDPARQRDEDPGI